MPACRAAYLCMLVVGISDAGQAVTYASDKSHGSNNSVCAMQQHFPHEVHIDARCTCR